MSVVLQNVFVWLFFAFLMLVSNAYLPLNSIPLILFVVLCFVDWQWVREKLIEYRWEGGLIGIALLIGIAFSELPGKSVKGVYDFLRGAILFFPVMYMRHNYPNRIVSILPWAVSVALTYLWGAVLWSSKGSLLSLDLMRPEVSPLVGYYNTYGTYAAVLCIVAMVGLIHSNSWSRFSLLMMTASVVAGLFLTIYSGSRGSVVALVAAILWLLLIRLPRWRWGILTSGLCFVLVFSSMVYSNWAGELMDSWKRNSADLTSGRLSMYIESFTNTLQNAPLTGYGPNTFKYLDYGQGLNFKNSMPHAMPHSIYLESLCSLGLLGSGLLLTALMLMFLRLKLHDWQGTCLHLGSTLMCFYLLRGLVDLKLFSVPYAGSFALAFALMLSSSKDPAFEQKDG